MKKSESFNPSAKSLADAFEEAEDSEARRRAHRMNSLPPRTDAEKAARKKAKKVRKRQKMARKRNRR